MKPFEVKEDKGRDIKKEFLSILSYDDVEKFMAKGDSTCTGKMNYSKAINNLISARDRINKATYAVDPSDYKSERLPAPDSTKEFVDKLVDAFKESLSNFLKTGTWEFKVPPCDAKDLEIYNKINDYIDYQISDIEKKFISLTKYLLKKGFDPNTFSGGDIAKLNVAEVSPESSDKFNSDRMKNYEPLSRGEKIYHGKYMTARYRQLGDVKYILKNPEDQETVRKYLHDVFNAFDNAWFAFAGRKTDTLDLTEANAIIKKHWEEEPITKKYDDKMAQSHYSVGGDCDLYACKDYLMKMADNRKKELDEINRKKAALGMSSSANTVNFDFNRMENYKPLSEKEASLLKSYLTVRKAQFEQTKNYNASEVDTLNKYLEEVFNAFDNAWFDFVNGKTSNLNLSNANAIISKWHTDYPITYKYDRYMKQYVKLGSMGLFDLHAATLHLYEMANERAKAAGQIMDGPSDEMTIWENSIDAIVDKDGKPVLKTYLDNWVQDVVDFYTDPNNIKKWHDEYDPAQARCKEIREDGWKLRNTVDTEIRNQNPNLSWVELNKKVSEDPRMIQQKEELEECTRIMNNIGPYIQIANMGEAKIRKSAEAQADAAKKQFVVNVCQQSGPVTDGRFWWAEDNHLNGWVQGEKGKFKVLTFFAGGYNTQRLHCRTRITRIG